MADTINVGVLRALLTLDTATYEAGMREAAGTAKQFTRDMQNIGSQMSAIGGRMTAAFTLPIVAAFGGAAKAAIDFESSFAGVRKTVEASEGEFAVMAQGLRDLAKQIPIDVNELNKLAESAGALGIPKKDIVDFTRVMAELGVTTNLTAEQAANDIAKIQNIFGSAGQATENFASTLVDLGNKGASTEDEILSLAARIASAGDAVGLTQAQVLGFSAAIANVGMEAEAGGSAMSRVLNELSKAASLGGKELEKFAKVAGTSARDFAKLFKEDAAQATTKFIEGLSKIREAGGNLTLTLNDLGFTELRQSDLLRRLSGDATGVATAVKTATEAWRENSALSHEAGERFKTTEAQLLLLWNRLKDVAITVGNALLPAIRAAVKVFDALVPWLEAAAKWFAELPGPIQLVAVGLLAVVAAAGPILLFFGQLAIAAAALSGAGGMGGLATKLGTLIPGVEGLTAALGFLRVGVTALMGPWGLLAAAVIALGAVLWEAAGGWDGISAAMQPVIQFAKDVGVILWDLAGRVFGKVVDAFSEVIGTIKGAIDWLASFVKASDDAKDPSRWDMLKQHATTTFQAIASEAAAAADVIRNLALIEKDHAALLKKRDADLKGMELKVPNAADLADMQAALDKIPPAVKRANVELGDQTEAIKRAKKAAQEADEAHREWKRTVAANTKVFELQAAEAEKFFAHERKLMDAKNTRDMQAIKDTADAQRDLTKKLRDAEFERAEFAIDQAERQGVSWQQLYAMQVDLSRRKLKAAIADAEQEFLVRTMWIDRETTFGQQQYDALRAIHDANVQGMVESHERAEMLKRDELDRTHNVWRRTIDSAKALVGTLTQSMSENFAAMLVGAQGFKEGFVGIWKSLQQHLMQILNDLLNYFISSFLKGMIGAMLGQQGAFSSAFSGLLGGGGGGTGGLVQGLAAKGGSALLGLVGIGGGNAATAGVLAGNAAIAGVGSGGAAAGAAGGAAAGGGLMSSMTAFLTNPWTAIGAGAILGGIALWKSGAFRGGEEALHVNPARDAFFQQFQNQFGGDQFTALAQAFHEAGVSGDIAERLIADLYRADEMDEFRAATEAIQAALEGTKEAAEAATAVVDQVGIAMTALEATIADVEGTGQVSGEAINALREAIAQLQASGVSAETIDLLNTTLETMISEGTASDEAIGALVDQVEQMTVSSAEQQVQVEDTTVATDGMTDAQRWLTDALYRALNGADDLAGAIQNMRNELAQPIVLPEIILPPVVLPEYIGGGGGHELVPPVDSMANEGIARHPMLAMIGDAREPEWVLHQSSVLGLMRRGMEFGANMTQAMVAGGDAAGGESTGGGMGDQFYLTAHISVDGAGQNGQTLAQQLVTALPLALRRDDGLRRKLRGAVN